MTRLQTLTRAVQCAIANGCARELINVPAWALSYGVSMKAVRETWEAELTKIAPGCDIGGEGK